MENYCQEQSFILPHSTVKTETATFAMGCFWTPDALFGAREGVIRTRVGYAGGSTENPDYRNLADHIETLQLEFDPERISYQDLLNIFFSHHKPFHEPWKRQYSSAVFVHHEEQEKLVQQVIEEIEADKGLQIFTEVLPYQKWYLAEDRHQKYKLQRKPDVLELLSKIFPDFTELTQSTVAARVNGFLYGYGSKKQVEEILSSFHLSPADRENLLKIIIAEEKSGHHTSLF